MGRRRATGTTVLAGIAVIVAMAALRLAAQGVASGPQEANAAKGKASDAAGAFRTSWGDPDLQGVWSYASLTPLERPAALKDREFFTQEEAAARDEETQTDSAPPPGDPGTYNALWFDRGKTGAGASLRTSLITDPPDGRLPLTEEARKVLAEKREYRRAHPADSWLDRTPWDRCITYHGVPPISTGYNNTYQILQTKDQVAILVENIHDVRLIPLDGRPRLSDGIRQWNGNSRGHWEGNTLVVETTNYSDKTEMRFPTSSHTRSVERFTRVGPDMIDYQFTVEDPTLYSKPWTAVRPMPRLKDYQIYEYACHEGNYAMSGILSGERAREKSLGRPVAKAQPKK